jgi:nicotinamide mononucleotide transporter
MIELIGVATALLGVFFSMRRHWIAWVWNIISSGVYLYVFYANQLYADMELQGLFIILGCIGLFSWNRSEQNWRAERSGVTHICLGVIFSLALGLGVGYLHTRYLQDASYPFLDGALAGFSVWATWLATQKKIVNWIVWIGVDVLYVGLYIQKEMWGTACLYAVFIALAIQGYRDWSNTLKSID